MTNNETNQIKETLEDHEKRISELEKIFKREPKISKKQISIKEFLISKKPKTEVQKTLVIGYYLEKYRGMKSFNAKDLENGFREAKEKVPGNINNRVIKNINNGHIMESKEKRDKLKAWCLTNTGERFVENDLKEK